MSTAPYPSWDVATLPGVHETQPAALDCPVVREHMDEQRAAFRAAVSRLGTAIHPDDPTAPADLQPHGTPTGDPLHELGWSLCVLVCSIGAVVMTVSLIAGWL